MTLTILFLVPAAFLAGLIDSMAGGGGLISLPALLVAGIPSHLALGTNKLQSCLGTTFSTARYLKGGHLYLPTGIAAAICALAGSFLGARLALELPGQFLLRLLPFLVAGVGVFTFLSPRFGEEDRFEAGKRWNLPVAAVLGLTIGAYDGFFGPGTGSFLAFFNVLFFRFGFVRATAQAKLANLASNVAALLTFAAARQVLWLPALAMAGANIAGNWLGAGLAIRKGPALIKPLFALVLLGLLVKLFFFA